MMSDPKPPTHDLIREAFQRGDFLGWFEAIYANANEPSKIPWAQMRPAPNLVGWAQAHLPQGQDQRALVVGCGLGDDAEFLAGLGYAVTAFDISPSAIDSAKARWTDSHVDYQVANLLELPQAWRGAFDLVLEHRTVQALPWQYCQPAISAIADCVALGGQALILTHGREPEEDRRGIPWRLSREELAQFHSAGLQEVQFDDLQDANGRREFRVLYQRPQA
jgi:SAM-dependent methyltransferase